MLPPPDTLHKFTTSRVSFQILLHQRMKNYSMIMPCNHIMKYVNTEDENISQTKIYGSFNKEQGLWEYPSVTTHKPREMMDPHIVNCTEERNDYIHSTKIDGKTGLYKTFHLKASTVTKQHTEIVCSCGTTYHKEGIYKDKGNTIHVHRSC